MASSRPDVCYSTIEQPGALLQSGVVSDKAPEGLGMVALPWGQQSIQRVDRCTWYWTVRVNVSMV